MIISFFLCNDNELIQSQKYQKNLKNSKIKIFHFNFLFLFSQKNIRESEINSQLVKLPYKSKLKKQKHKIGQSPKPKRLRPIKILPPSTFLQFLHIIKNPPSPLPSSGKVKILNNIYLSLPHHT